MADMDLPAPLPGEHDPALGPHPGLSKPGVLEPRREGLGRGDLDAWGRVDEFLRDKMTLKDLKTHDNGMTLARFLVELYGADGNAQCAYLYELADALAKVISQEMPPVGPPHIVN